MKQINNKEGSSIPVFQHSLPCRHAGNIPG